MVIYKITNLVNKKIYIGQTARPIEKRFGKHANSYSLIGKAIQEYGQDNFKIEVIEKCNSKTELNEREKFWMETLNSKAPNGYNKIMMSEKSFQDYVTIFYSLISNIDLSNDNDEQIMKINLSVKEKIMSDNEGISLKVINNAINIFRQHGIFEYVDKFKYKLNKKMILQKNLLDVNNLKWLIMYNLNK